MMTRKSDVRVYESQKIFISRKYAGELKLPRKPSASGLLPKKSGDVSA